MLWVVTPSNILLYNCYSKPSSDYASDSSEHLIDFFDKTEAELRRLNDFAGLLQIESGRFWQKEKAKQIDRRQRVDRALLNDLQEVENLLVEEGLDRSVAHALLGRTIFVAYLQDRKILKQQFFISRYQSKSLSEIMANKSATYDLFEWVHKTFNGDLFPLKHVVSQRTMLERNLVKHNHLETIREWISKTDMKTGQKSLWPYDFSVVPVELISSIYEMFAHADDTSVARERSTHYTPINLVDLVLSQVFEGLPADANILDLSCGSGVFLVEALRRLVAGRLADGAEWTREMTREVLYKQIYGVDINKEAVQIAAFSLYLTALDLDPDPQPPSALKFRPLIEQNLFSSDAFDENAPFNKQEPFASKNFGAVVGNPPWKRSKSNKSGAEYCAKRNYPISRENPDQAFLWRIGDFANNDTVIGVILHSKPFFSHTNTAHKAKEAIFKRYRSRVWKPMRFN